MWPYHLSPSYACVHFSKGIWSIQTKKLVEILEPTTLPEQLVVSFHNLWQCKKLNDLKWLCCNKNNQYKWIKLRYIIMFINCLFTSTFLNFLLKLNAMWLMQYTNRRPCPFQATSGDFNVEKMVFPLSVIMQIFCCSMTCDRNRRKNQINATFVSPSTIAKGKGNMLWLSSWPIAVSKVPWYFPVKNVLLTWTIGL